MDLESITQMTSIITSPTMALIFAGVWRQFTKINIEIDEVKKIMIDLNTKLAVIIERTDNHDHRINRVENHIFDREA